MRRRRRFLAPLYPRGFTPTLQRQLQLPGHLRLVAFEIHGRFALLFVRSFATRVATTTSADFSAPQLRRPFRRKPRAPQVRTLSFTARPPDLRRLSFGHRSFAVHWPLAPLDAASDPVLVHRPAVSLPASFPRSVALTQLRFASIRMTSFRRDLHPQDSAHAGRTTRKARGLRPRALLHVTLAMREQRSLSRQPSSPLHWRSPGRSASRFLRPAG